MKTNHDSSKRDLAHEGEQRRAPDLDSRYGNIGISAVVAALRYGGDAKNIRYAPADPAPWRQHEDAA